MKMHSVSNYGVLGFSRQLRAFAVACVGLGFVACENYTVEPVCNQDNAATLQGITGAYEFSKQDSETFNVVTDVIEIDHQNSKLIKSHGGQVKQSSLCYVNGRTIEEVERDEGGYEQRQIFVTGMGITSSPLLYDAAALDAAGISYKILEVPNSVTKGLKFFGFDNLAQKIQDKKALEIDNVGVSASDLVSTSKTGPVGFSLLRK